ncbi:MAG: DMT family protein [Candidatus Ratteibacteria bacterium]|nr:DMT family protein [Candidatus Ratteibacteria bacterium]
MHRILITTVMLICSNIFMTFAWYAHLKNLGSKPWIVATFASWGIAFFEYLLQVPANRIGYAVMNLGQLKILQEVITLSVFIPFSIFYMKEGIKQEYYFASLFMLAAVVCVFKGAIVK